MQGFSLLFRLLRVEQWVKNLFIFLPAFFSLKLLQWPSSLNLIYAFLGFSLVASAIYVFNDMRDVEEDRLHPEKSKRPIASGEVSLPMAYTAVAVLLASATLIYVLLVDNIYASLVLLLYLIQNVLYTFKLKQIAILDVMIIAVGFVLRIYVGGLVSNTALSSWIILMTFILALFLAFAKRRDDAFRFEQTGISLRKNMQGYNLRFLDTVLAFLATVIFLAYLMYCTSADVTERFGHHVYLTAFFVLLGILRYLQLTFVWLISGNPTKILLGNRFLQLIVLGWILSFFVIIYINKVI